jgi:TatD DNase family protein
VLRHLEGNLPQERGRAVLHWFTGTAAQAGLAAELGCYFSINAEMLKSQKHRSLISKLPRDRLLTETDGPFVSTRERVARPPDVAHTVTTLAGALLMTPTDVQALIVRNLANLTRS